MSLSGAKRVKKHAFHKFNGIQTCKDRLDVGNVKRSDNSSTEDTEVRVCWFFYRNDIQGWDGERGIIISTLNKTSPRKYMIEYRF